MTIGHFAQGFVDTYTQMSQAKKDNDLREKIAKLQGQLLEAQLKTSEGQQFARDRMTEMMTSGFDLQSPGRLAVPDFDFGDPNELTEIGGVALHRNPRICSTCLQETIREQQHFKVPQCNRVRWIWVICSTSNRPS